MEEKMIYLTCDNFPDYCPLNPIVFSFAEFGAMGSPGNVEIVQADGTTFCFNLSCFHSVTIRGAICPTLWECLYGDPEDWEHINMGAGNHLFLKQPYYDEFCQRLKEFKEVTPAWIYQNWMNIVQKMIVKELI